MAERFARDGRLIACGCGAAARSDARHIAVEFVHPVIVGKRALPAVAVTGNPNEVGRTVDLLAGPDDILIGFEPDSGGLADAFGRARRAGLLTLAFAPLGAEWEFVPGTA